jgi:uncharacterized membrane protein
MAIFFADAARRIYVELKSNSQALNLNSMVIHILAFLVYVTSGIVEIIINAKIYKEYY